MSIIISNIECGIGETVSIASSAIIRARLPGSFMTLVFMSCDDKIRLGIAEGLMSDIPLLDEKMKPLFDKDGVHLLTEDMFTCFDKK